MLIDSDLFLADNLAITTADVLSSYVDLVAVGESSKPLMVTASVSEAFVRDVAAEVAAEKVLAEITWTAVTAGADGNDIRIKYTAGATAGAEVVTVDGTDIEVQIENNASTAAQVRAAVAAEAEAAALIVGAGGTTEAQLVATAATFQSLTGGSSQVPTLTIQILTDNDSAFGSPKVLHQVSGIALSDLTLGATLIEMGLPSGLERYIAANLVLDGDEFTAGKLNIFLSHSDDSKNIY